MSALRTHSRNNRLPWQKRRRRALLAIALLIILVGGGVSVFRWQNHARTKALLETLRASGIPTTTKELENQYPTPPQGENAAETYQKAFDAGKYDTPDDSYREIDDKLSLESKNATLPKTLSELLRGMIREYLETQKEPLRLLHEAAKHPNSRYPLSLSGDLRTMKLPHLTKIRQSVHLLKLEAMLAADDKDLNKAVDAIHAMLAVGDSIRQEPLISSQLTRLSCHYYTFETLRYVFANTTLTEEQLGRLNTIFENRIDPGAFARGLQCEYLTSATIFDRPDRVVEFYPDFLGIEKYVHGATRPLMKVAAMTGWTEADRNHYLNRLGERIAISRLPIYEAVPAMRAFENEEQRGKKWIPTISGEFSIGLTNTVCAFGRDQVLSQFASTAIAVERYQLFASKFPDAITDLVPSFLSAVPQDPFDGKPLRYRRTENGFLVYSAGYNQRDDGGIKPADNQDMYQTNDIIFTLER